MFDTFVIVLFLVAIFGLAGLLLWLRDRRWDRKGVSEAARAQHQRRLVRGVGIYWEIGHSIGAVSFLAAALKARTLSRAIVYGAVAMLFFWLAVLTHHTRRTSKADKFSASRGTFEEGSRPPGTPPPIG